MSPALVLDCDGVLADTERDGHLPAFNETFAEVGLPVRWTLDDYARLVTIGGGKERMASVLSPELVEGAGLPADAEGQAALLRDWHRRKTAHYVRRVTSGALPARPGIARLVEEVAVAGWRLAVASTSSEVAVRAVLEHAVGPRRAEDVTVFAGDVVPRKKPAPDVYQLALRSMGLDPADVVVVEDSANGLRASTAAGLTTVVTVSSMTAEEDFTGAALVVSSLGDAAEPARVLDDPYGVAPAGQVTMEHLRQLLDRARRA